MFTCMIKNILVRLDVRTHSLCIRMYGFHQMVEICLSFLCHLSLSHCLILLRMSSLVVLCKSISYFLHNSSYGCWQVCLYACIQLFGFSSVYYSFNCMILIFKAFGTLRENAKMKCIGLLYKS